MLEAGQRVAQFRIVGKLGQGGMGVVYRAQDETLGRAVALKVLPPDLMHDPDRRARFLREARAAAAVTHPNIATIYQVDQEAGTIFIAMELVGGGSLDTWLGAHRLSVTQALGIGAELSAAVACAHRAGVVHRDLKPANIMVTADGHVKVLDFGIAKLLPNVAESGVQGPTALGNAATEQAQASATREGNVLGTAGYMSPEQATGRPVDARTDVFSIGVILYELLTGQRPFRGSTFMDVVISTTRDEPTPVSQVNPRVPKDVEELLVRCLRKDPNQRPPNGDALHAELTQLLAGAVSGGVSQTQPSPGAPSPAGVAQAPSPTTTTGVVDTIDSAGGSPRKGRGALWAAVGVTLFMSIVAFGFVAYRAGWLSEPTPPEAGLAALSRYANPDDSRAANLPAPMWATAAQDFARAARQRGAPERWSAARHFALGQEALSLGHLDQAQAAFERSVQIDAEWALPHLGLSSLRLRQKNTDGAIKAAQRAQVLDAKLWSAVAAAGRAYAHAEKYEFAIEEYRRALSMAPDKPFLISELALTYHAALMDEQAKRHAERALSLDPDIVPALILLAERALEDKKGEEARRYARHATGVEPREVTAWLALGDALLLLNRLDDARQAHRRAVDLWRETHQQGAPEERLKVVETALEEGKRPPLRGEEDAVEVAGDSQQTESEADSNARSRPRSVPRRKPRSKPKRTSGAGARSDPSGLLDNL